MTEFIKEKSRNRFDDCQKIAEILQKASRDSYRLDQAKYAGIFWSKNDSGNFRSEDHHLKKTGNSYLRYYFIEATVSVIHHNQIFYDFYSKKLLEVKTHKESRALVLTSRKFIRLIFKLLKDKKFYQDPSIN